MKRNIPFLPATTTCDPSFDVLNEFKAPSTLQNIVEKLVGPPPSPGWEEKIDTGKATFCLNYNHSWTLKVHLSPKYFFCSNKSLHLFEMHCAFWPLLNPNVDLLQAVKVTKSGHHLSHDRASKGYGSTPGLTSQTSLHACLQRLNTMQISLWRQTRIRPMPLLARSCERWWLDFVTFTT